MDGAPHDVLLPSLLLGRIAAELERCREILSRVEHSVHDIIDHHRLPQDAGSWQRNLQDIDLLEQHLGDLAHCLSNAARDPALLTTPSLEARQILDGLRLDDLRQRLAGRNLHPRRPRDVDLF